MAKSYNIHDTPILFKTILETNQNLFEAPPQRYDNLISTLPVRSYGPHQLRLYKGFLIPQLILRGALAMQENFNSRPSNLFLASYPKSGTTWLKALIFATMTHTSYPLDQHPLLMNNPHECIAYMDMLFSTGQSSVVEMIPSPRILNTHLPYSLLPDSIVGSDCKILYTCRDPKDVFVSQYYFLREFLKGVDNKNLFNEMFDMFCQGSSQFGPVWDHNLGYWKESLRRPDKLLFLKYEEMLHEPIKHVMRLAEFIRCPFSEAEQKQGVVERIIELCNFQNLKNLEVNKTKRPAIFDKNVSHAIYFRKGVVGDWRNQLTPDMAQRLDSITKEKFKSSGLDILMMSSEPTSSCIE